MRSCCKKTGLLIRLFFSPSPFPTQVVRGRGTSLVSFCFPFKAESLEKEGLIPAQDDEDVSVGNDGKAAGDVTDKNAKWEVVVDPEVQDLDAKLNALPSSEQEPFIDPKAK